MYIYHSIGRRAESLDSVLSVFFPISRNRIISPYMHTSQKVININHISFSGKRQKKKKAKNVNVILRTRIQQDLSFINPQSRVLNYSLK